MTTSSYWGTLGWYCGLGLLFWFRFSSSYSLGLSRCRFCRLRIILESSDVFFIFNKNCNNLAQRNILSSFIVEQSCNISLFLHLKVYYSFISFNSS